MGDRRRQARVIVMCDINIKMIYGYRELKQFDKFKNGRMFTYGYSICYDRDGKAVLCTIPELISSIGWDDGSPFLSWKTY